MKRNISIGLLSWREELMSVCMCFIQHSCWPLSSPLPSTNMLSIFFAFYFVFIIFTSSHSVWHFFLPHNLLHIFSILNTIHFCLWREMHWFICLDRHPQSCTSTPGSDHTSITSVDKDVLHAAKIRKDSGHP